MSLYEYEDISSSGNYKPGISDISILPDLSSTNDTPLHVAIKTMNLNMVSLLLKDKKCNVNALATGDLTPLHLGARTGNELIFNMLLQAGANIRAQDQNGWTCLHYGAFYGNYEIVEIILTHASGLLNVIDNAHHTALHLACRMGLLKIIIKLLEQGAALDIVDNAQNIPTDYLPPIVPSSDSIVEKNPEILSLQTLGQNMRMLFQSPDHSDLEFFLYDVNNDSNSPPHIFRSHRAIIQFRCPSLLETGPNRAYEGTNRIIIRNIPLNVFQAVLEYIYCGVITFINDEIDLEFALTLSKKGEELKMLSLTQYCENLICSLIPDSENDAETVLTVLETAKSTPRVVNYCRYLILKNLNKFMKFVSSNIEFSQTFTSHLLAFLKIVNIEAPGAIPRIALANKDTAPSLTFDLRDQPKDPILINDTINKISSKHIQEMTKNSNKKPSRIPPTAGIINSPYDGTIASSGYVMSPDGNNNSGIHPDYERTIIGTTPNYVNQEQLQQQKQQQLQQKQLQQQHLQQQHLQQQQQLQQQQHIHHHHHQKQQQQQQRAKYVKNYGNADLLQGPLLDAVLNIMKELFSKVPQVEDFITPVNYIVLGLPDYPDVVGRPMDLTTISKNLENKNYKTLREWALDVRQVWDNARVYNQSECNIHQSADQLSKFFESRYMELQNNAVDLDTDYDPTPEEMNFYEAYIKGLNRYRIRSGQLPLEIPKNNQEYPCPADKYNVNHNAKPSGIKKTQQKPIGPKKRTRNAMEMTQNLQGLQHNLIPPGSIIHNTGSITMNNPMNPLPSPMPPNIDVSMAPRNNANMIPNPNQTPPPNPNNDPMNSLNGNQKLPFSPDEWAEIEQLILNLDPESSHQVVQILGIRPNESGEFFIQSGEISLTKYLQLKKYLAAVKPRTILNGSHA